MFICGMYVKKKNSCFSTFYNITFNGLLTALFVTAITPDISFEFGHMGYVLWGLWLSTPVEPCWCWPCGTVCTLKLLLNIDAYQQ